MIPRSVTILGSTGSIGRQTLDVLALHGPAAFRVEALTAARNAALLAEQARGFRPSFVALADPTALAELKDRLSDLPEIEIAAGPDAVVEAASRTADITVAAIVGVAGLLPAMTAIGRGATVAFASKECLVAAGRLMMAAVNRAGATLLPLDSEHNAIFQVLHGQDAGGLRRIVLTASGGPFRDWSRDSMCRATPEQAVAHPKWSMGPKISVDSATLMNKALEVIEAHHLFNLPSEKIDVLIHPQSVVHGMVEYADGSLLAQMGPADMHTPISMCLGWPARIKSPGAALDLAALSRLDFEAPDMARFPALRLVREVMAGASSDAIVFNAANEVAVEAFLNRRIGFTDILDKIARMLDDGHITDINTLEDVLACDADARRRMNERLSGER